MEDVWPNSWPSSDGQQTCLFYGNIAQNCKWNTHCKIKKVNKRKGKTDKKNDNDILCPSCVADYNNYQLCSIITSKESEKKIAQTCMLSPFRVMHP